MTCIVGLVEDKKVYMGGDSMVTGYVTQIMTFRKVFKHNNCIIGYSGSVRMCNLLQYAFTVPEHSDGVSVEQYLTTTFVDALRTLMKDAGNATKVNEQEGSTGFFLIGYRGRLFKISSDYSLTEVAEGFDAVGSGSDVALGAMYATKQMSLKPKKRIELALEAASHLCWGVGEPFYVESLDEVKS